jgi:DHA1 family inner membrane transport protein
MQERETASNRALIATLSAGNFAIGMGAFVVIGVLSPIADDLALSKTAAGMVMTVYAIAYAVLSPVLISLTGAIDRRTILISALVIFIAAAMLAAVSTTPLLLYTARVLGALGAGLFTPVAASVAFSMSRPERRGSALAAVFFGMTLAQALGLPAGSFIGYTFGWQAVFVAVAILSAATLVLAIMTVPRAIPFQANSLGTLASALMDWRSMLSVLFTASFTAAAYIVYTFIGPLLEQQMGFGRDGVTLTLLVYGVGAVAGSLAAGRLTDRFGSRNTMLFVVSCQIVITPFYSFLPQPILLFGIVTFLWALLGWSFMVPQQARLIRQTPERQSVVLALNAACIYVGAAIGSAIGASVAERQGLEALGIAAAIAMVAALLHLVLSEVFAPRPK